MAGFDFNQFVEGVDTKVEGILGDNTNAESKASILSSNREEKIKRLGEQQDYANLSNTYTVLPDGRQESNANKIYNDFSPIEQQFLFGYGTAQGYRPEEDMSSSEGRRLYMYPSKSGDSIKPGVSTGGADTSDVRYDNTIDPKYNQSYRTSGPDGPDLQNKILDMPMDFSNATVNEALLHGNKRLLDQRKYPDQLSPESLAKPGGGASEYYKGGIDNLMGDATNETLSKERERELMDYYDTQVSRQKAQKIGTDEKYERPTAESFKADTDGYLDESVDIGQSSIISTYGKINKGLRNMTRAAANKIADWTGVDRSSVDKWLPKVGETGTLGFGDLSSDMLAQQEVADKITGVMAKTREEQQAGQKKSLEAIEKGDYGKAAWEQFKLLGYSLGDSAGELAAIAGGAPGIALAVVGRVNEDAEEFAANNDGKKWDNTQLLGSVILNTAALASERFLLKSGIKSIVDKGATKAGVGGATLVSAVGEAAQEYFDQVQQKYMTQKEGDQALGEIASSDEAKLAALAGGVMGGTLRGTGEAGSAAVDAAAKSREDTSKEVKSEEYQNQVFSSIKTQDDAELAMETFSLNKERSESMINNLSQQSEEISSLNTKEEILEYVENNPLAKQVLASKKEGAELYNSLGNTNVSTDTIEKLKDFIKSTAETEIKNLNVNVEKNTILENALNNRIMNQEFTTSADAGANVLLNSTTAAGQDAATAVGSYGTVMEGTVDLLNSFEDNQVTPENAEVFEGFKSNILRNVTSQDETKLAAVQQAGNFDQLRQAVNGFTVDELYNVNVTGKDAKSTPQKQASRTARIVSGILSPIIKLGPQSTYNQARARVADRFKNVSDQVLQTIARNPETIQAIASAFEGQDGFKPVSANDISKILKAELNKRQSSRQASKARPVQSTASDSPVVALGELLESGTAWNKARKTDSPSAKVGNKTVTTEEEFKQAYSDEFSKLVRTVPLDFLEAVVTGDVAELTGDLKQVATRYAAMFGDRRTESVESFQKELEEVYKQRKAQETPVAVRSRVLGALNKESVESQAEMDSLIKDLDGLLADKAITQQRYDIIKSRLKALDIRSKAKKASSKAQAKAEMKAKKEEVLNDEVIHTNEEIKDLIKEGKLSDKEFEYIYNTRYFTDNTWNDISEYFEPDVVEDIKDWYNNLSPEEQRQVVVDVTNSEQINVC